MYEVTYAWYPRRTPIFWIALYMVMRGRMMLMFSRGVATSIMECVRSLGINAYHAEAVSGRGLNEQWAAGFMRDYDPEEALVFATWEWVQRYAMSTDFGRRFLDQFFLVGFSRVKHWGVWLNRINADYVKNKIPPKAPWPEGVIVRPRRRPFPGRNVHPFVRMHFLRQDHHKRLILQAIQTARNLQTPTPFDLRMANYLWDLSEGRLLADLQRLDIRQGVRDRLYPGPRLRRKYPK